MLLNIGMINIVIIGHDFQPFSELLYIMEYLAVIGPEHFFFRNIRQKPLGLAPPRSLPAPGEPVKRE